MREISTSVDWNAADARRSAPPLGLGVRLGLLFSSPRAALRALDTSGEVDTRAQNLLDGLVERARIPRPQLHVYRGAPNALVAPGRQPAVAISDGALTELARTELEALLAHCVVRIASARRTDPVGYDDDVRAAALTRYPPGLAKALEKLTVRSGSGAHWFTAADSPSHRAVAERIAALNEL